MFRLNSNIWTHLPRRHIAILEWGTNPNQTGRYNILSTFQIALLHMLHFQGVSYSILGAALMRPNRLKLVRSADIEQRYECIKPQPAFKFRTSFLSTLKVLIYLFVASTHLVHHSVALHISYLARDRWASGHVLHLHLHQIELTRFIVQTFTQKHSCLPVAVLHSRLRRRVPQIKRQCVLQQENKNVSTF